MLIDDLHNLTTTKFWYTFSKVLYKLIPLSPTNTSLWIFCLLLQNNVSLGVCHIVSYFPWKNILKYLIQLTICLNSKNRKMWYLNWTVSISSHSFQQLQYIGLLVDIWNLFSTSHHKMTICGHVTLLSSSIYIKETRLYAMLLWKCIHKGTFGMGNICLH